MFFIVSMKVVNDINITNNNCISDKGFINKDRAITMFHLNPMKHFKNFTIDEYSKLNNRELNVLRKRYNKLKAKKEKYYSSIETVHKVLADSIKSRFDKLYGEGNYTVIVIGRSLSSVGKLLGYNIGENNVKNIPLSSAQKYHSGRIVKEAKEEGKLQKFLDFLKSLHLSKDDIEKDKNRKFVLIDYCISGYSLQGAFDLLQSKFVLGIQENFFKEDILNACIKDAQMLFDIKNLLYAHGLKDFSFVKKCEKLENTPKAIVKPSKEGKKTKLFWFNLLDMAMKDKIIKNTEGSVI